MRLFCVAEAIYLRDIAAHLGRCFFKKAVEHLCCAVHFGEIYSAFTHYKNFVNVGGKLGYLLGIDFADTAVVCFCFAVIFQIINLAFGNVEILFNGKINYRRLCYFTAFKFNEIKVVKLLVISGGHCIINSFILCFSLKVNNILIGEHKLLILYSYNAFIAFFIDKNTVIFNIIAFNQNHDKNNNQRNRNRCRRSNYSYLCFFRNFSERIEFNRQN